MEDIYMIEGGLENIERLHISPDLPMWLKVPESEKEEVLALNSKRYEIEHVPEKKMYARDRVLHADGFFKVRLARPSFRATAETWIRTIAEEGVGSYFEIESGRNTSSERSTLHNLATTYGIKVSVSKSNQTLIVTHVSKSAKYREPNWWKRVKECQGLPVTLKIPGRFDSFRSKVYNWAKSKGVRVQVLGGDGPDEAVVTYLGKRDDKPVTQRFNELIESLPYDTPSDVPEWLSEKSDATIRVMCSNHAEPLSFRKGKLIRPAPPTTHRRQSDSNENFVYDGKDYGPRSEKWIEIFMRRKGE